MDGLRTYVRHLFYKVHQSTDWLTDWLILLTYLPMLRRNDIRYLPRVRLHFWFLWVNRVSWLTATRERKWMDECSLFMYLYLMSASHTHTHTHPVFYFAFGVFFIYGRTKMIGKRIWRDVILLIYIYIYTKSSWDLFYRGAVCSSRKRLALSLYRSI